MTTKKPYNLSRHNKEKNLQAINTHLQSHRSVLFAFAHGSFLEDDLPFRDIDIAVFIDQQIANTALLDLCLELSARLSALVRLPVDVHALNTCSISFCYEVTRGKLLFTRDIEISFDFIEKTRLEYFDLKPMYDENLKDLLYTRP